MARAGGHVVRSARGAMHLVQVHELVLPARRQQLCSRGGRRSRPPSDRLGGPCVCSDGTERLVRLVPYAQVAVVAGRGQQRAPAVPHRGHPVLVGIRADLGRRLA
jgi:hypothetical protein